jgi:hypothetical protein
MLCLFRVLLGRQPLLQAFPSLSTLGEVALYPPSPAGLFIYSHVGSVPSPLSSGTFLTQPLLQAFLLQGCWAGAATLAFSGRLVYLWFREGLLQPPLWLSGHPPSLLCVFCCCCYVLFSLVFFSFFFGWGVSLPRGLC